MASKDTFIFATFEYRDHGEVPAHHKQRILYFESEHFTIVCLNLNGADTLTSYDAETWTLTRQAKNL